jgi:hypothetical protein
LSIDWRNNRSPDGKTEAARNGTKPRQIWPLLDRRSDMISIVFINGPSSSSSTCFSAADDGPMSFIIFFIFRRDLERSAYDFAPIQEQTFHGRVRSVQHNQRLGSWMPSVIRTKSASVLSAWAIALLRSSRV